ncbi:TIGR04086 family membrane protein [Paenibacillus senegalensis]|uniref:TIGR04086 family membrane protein n=1 Tax=Paenibacillus senegalensis TaxID=1465766 RepID=UPI000289776B|nr:TIGR04086 family membrane protein [Paenibacillus senegalensis]
MEFKDKVRSVSIQSPILAGLFYAFIVMSIAAVITSLILLLTSQNEDALSAYAYLIHSLSLLLGGWIAGKKAEEKGWYYGGLFGLIYSVIVFVIGFLGFDKGLDWNMLAFVVAAFFLGALGGVVGVNMKK